MKNTFKILIKSPKFLIGFFVLMIMVLLINIYPMVNHADPFNMIGLSFEKPSKAFFMGTDNFGRDAFLELMYGIRTSIQIGLIAGCTATAIGMFVGLVSGYLGGVIDDIMTTFTNMFIVIPSIIILILVSVSLNTRSSITIAIIIGLTSWPWTARAVRAQIGRAHV